MAAHVRQIVWPCSYPGCKRQATHEVHNTKNAPMGRYCKRHAEVELKRFIRDHPDQA